RVARPSAAPVATSRTFTARGTAAARNPARQGARCRRVAPAADGPACCDAYATGDSVRTAGSQRRRRLQVRLRIFPGDGYCWTGWARPPRVAVCDHRSFRPQPAVLALNSFGLEPLDQSAIQRLVIRGSVD